MSDLPQILREFEEDLNRATHLLQLMKGFREFGGSAVPLAILDGGVSWTEAVTLHGRAGPVRTDLPILSGSLLLYLAGRFEYFVKQVIQHAAEEIAAHSTNYTHLPDALRAELRSLTLEVAKNPPKYGYDQDETDALLGALVETVHGKTKPSDLRAEILTITEANMKGRVLADLTKRIGMTDFWQSVGRQAAVKLHLETTADGETTNAAQTRLNKIMDERNQVAHPTSATEFPDPDKVLRHASFLGVLGTTVVGLVQVYLAAHRRTAPSVAAASAGQHAASPAALATLTDAQAAPATTPIA